MRRAISTWMSAPAKSTIVMHEDDVRSVRLGVGIGEASLSVAGRSIEGSGWLGHKVRWGEGTGASRVAVNWAWASST